MTPFPPVHRPVFTIPLHRPVFTIPLHRPVFTIPLRLAFARSDGILDRNHRVPVTRWAASFHAPCALPRAPTQGPTPTKNPMSAVRTNVCQRELDLQPDARKDHRESARTLTNAETAESPDLHRFSDPGF